MNCHCPRAVLTLVSLVCIKAYGASVRYDGNGYGVLCKVDGNEQFLIQEYRTVEGDSVEQSVFVLLADTKLHPLRNRALSYIERFRSCIDPTNAVAIVTNEVGCSTKGDVCFYDFGAKRGERFLSSGTARRLAEESRQFVDSCRQLVETAGYDERVIYYRQRYKKGIRVLRAKYEDVVGMAHLYSGLRVAFPARAMLLDDDDYLRLAPPDKKFSGEWRLCQHQWPACESIDVAAYKGGNDLAVFVEGRIAPLPSGGVVSMNDLKMHEKDSPEAMKGGVSDGDEFLSMEYLSPCQEFKLLLREEKYVKCVSYCCGVLVVVRLEGNLALTCAGTPYDVIDETYVALSGYAVCKQYLEVKQKLKRLAASLDRDSVSPICKTKRYSTISPIVKDAKQDRKIYDLVEDLLLSLAKSCEEIEEI